MKRLLVIGCAVLVLLGGLWLGGTAVYGALTASGVTRFAEGVNEPGAEESALDAISMRVEDYRKGFFSSRFRSTFFLASEEGNTEPDAVVTDESGLPLKHEIYHGPVAMTPDGPKFCHSWILTTVDRDALPPEAEEEIHRIFGPSEPVTIKTLTGYTNSTRMWIDIPPVDYDVEGQKVTGGGLSLEVDLGSGGERFAIHGGTGELLVKADGEGMRILPASLEFHWAEGKGLAGEFAFQGASADSPNGDQVVLEPGSFKVDLLPMWHDVPVLSGPIKVHLSGLQFTNVQGAHSMRDLFLSVDSGVQDGGVYGLYGLGVGSTTIPEGDSKMALLQGGFELEFGGRGMNPEAIKEIARVNMKMQEAQWASMAQMLPARGERGSAAVTPVASEEDISAMVDGLLAILSPGFEIYLKAKLGEGGEDGTLDLVISMAGERPLVEHRTLRDIINALEAKASVRLRKDSVPPDTAMMLAAQAEMGMIGDSGDQWEFQADMTGGALNMRGQKTPILESFGPMLDEPIEWDPFLEGFREAIAAGLVGM